MTDEEKLAEEYAKANAKKGLSYREVTRTYDEITGYPYFLEDKIKKAFLAGLKADRPKWHDLRKNPLDLPTENCTVLIYTDWQGMELKTFFVDTRLFENLTFREVIAWCEIPKYTEE